MPELPRQILPVSGRVTAKTFPCIVEPLAAIAHQIVWQGAQRLHLPYMTSW